MTVAFVTGDMFARTDVDAYAHGCNCRGVMGSGVALEMKRRYPAMFREYVRRCSARPPRFAPGDAFFFPGGMRPHVFCLATQDGFGHRGVHARVEYIASACRAMLRLADEEEIATIAMPAVGCGLGGLLWPDVKPALTEVLAPWRGLVTVYEPRGRAS